MKYLHSYFIEHGLFDDQSLREHCARHCVQVYHTERLPHLRLLHYSDEAVFEHKWSDFCKMCRGVVVDIKNKELLAIPWFKFWNVGEDQAPSYAELQKMGEFEVSEKLDGSMGILFFNKEEGKFRVTTKGSFESEQSVWATEHIPESVKSMSLVNTYTLMFEIIWHRNRVVVDYSKKGYPEGLYLIGVRHKASQKVFSYKEVQEVAKQYNLPTMKTYTFASLDEVMNQAKTLPFMEEGYVIRFKSTGVMVKVKGPEYLRVHRFISRLEDKNLLECMIAGQEKDVLQAAPEEYRNEVISTIENYRKQALEVQKQCYEYFSLAPKEERKGFALWVQQNVPTNVHKYLFKLMDQKPLELRMIYESFRKVRQPSLGVVNVPNHGIVAMVGVSGSGKSTLAHKLFALESIISSDKCREIILWKGNPPEGLSASDYWTKMQGVSREAFMMVHENTEAQLRNLKVAVVDATNLNGRARSSLEQIAKKHNVPITYIVLSLDELVCVDRDAKRKYPVGAPVIAKQCAQLTQTIQDLSGKSNVVFVTSKTVDQLSIRLVELNNTKRLPMDIPELTDKELASARRVTPEETEALQLVIAAKLGTPEVLVKKDTILVDLDGTLANIEHRLHFVQNNPPNWDMFFKTCSKDLPNEWCVELIKAMKASGHRVILVSARSRMVLEDTKQWLAKIGLLDFVEIQMVRAENDSTADQILKQRWLDSFDKNRVLFVVDDRQRVVDMWRANGLTCLQCAYWEERPKAKKATSAN